MHVLSLCDFQHVYITRSGPLIYTHLDGIMVILLITYLFNIIHLLRVRLFTLLAYALYDVNEFYLGTSACNMGLNDNDCIHRLHELEPCSYSVPIVYDPCIMSDITICLMSERPVNTLRVLASCGQSYNGQCWTYVWICIYVS